MVPGGNHQSAEVNRARVMVAAMAVTAFVYTVGLVIPQVFYYSWHEKPWLHL